MTAQSNTKTRAWRLFLATHSAVLDRIEARFAKAGLPPLAWYDLLWELEKASEGKLRMYELADRIVLSRSNLTRLADRLEAAGLLRREACADDGRGAYCVMTEAGRKMRKQMWPVYRSQIDSLFAEHLSETEAKALGDSLAKILRAMTEARVTA